MYGEKAESGADKHFHHSPFTILNSGSIGFVHGKGEEDG